jgi:mitochondrial fission protein ELM1
LFCVPEHDRLRGDNVFTTLIAPHSFSRRKLEELRQNLPAYIAALPCPRVAVLLGGSNGDYTYTERALDRLAAALGALRALGAGLMITPSRRTEPAIIARVKSATDCRKCIFWNMKGENPYPQFLAHADAFVAPADSVNMTGEPCATGKPVYVFHPDGGSAKFRRFHEALQRIGATRPLPSLLDSIDSWSYEPLNSAELIAEEIARRWKAVHALSTDDQVRQLDDR